ncbi:MAG: ATP-binding protein [Candidatus Sumerlaeia bacterium]|nr:ATP-binding protein [Candidatus Sumerlaeia bacterium]
MEELALHILDIAENSIRAGAQTVEIEIVEDVQQDRLHITIRDNGKGMDKRTLRHALDPFFTTKVGKRVGLGLPLLAAAARQAGGDIAVRSKRGAGTEVEAVFQYSHADRQPLGNLGATLETLIIGNPDVDFRLLHRSPKGEKQLDTRDIRAALNGAPINSIEGIRRVKQSMEENGWL